jgi:hypothetical protein
VQADGYPGFGALYERQRAACGFDRSPASPFVFVSEGGALLSAVGFGRMIERAAVAAKLNIKAHAHIPSFPVVERGPIGGVGDTPVPAIDNDPALWHRA